VTYATEITKTSSEKFLLAHIYPSERLILFTLHSGSVYKRENVRFTRAVYQSGTALVAAANNSLNAGEFFYDIAAGTLYVRMSDDSNPNTKIVVVDYKFFFSDKPHSRAHDLASGAEVYYEGLLRSSSPIKKEIDSELIGTALESSTTLNLINYTAYFDEVYDTLIWENKAVQIYSCTNDQTQLIFDGIIQDKTYSDAQVSFKCKDYLFKLRQPLAQTFFSDSDGTILDKYLNTPKRTLFGQFHKLKAIPVDSIKDGYDLTGTVSAAIGATTLTGSGTLFLDELSPNDKIFITSDAGNVFEFGVQAIASNTSLTLSDDVEETITAKPVANQPERPWRKKNRTWHIAGHKLRAPSTTVDVGLSENRFTVLDPSDFFAGDSIDVNGEDAFILRVSGDQITLVSNLQSGAPSNGDAVTKNPVSKAYIFNDEAFINRDFTITNTTESKIELTDTAEFNIAKDRALAGTLSFTNGSRTVTATSVDLLNYLKPRDWVQSNSITHTTWYEILAVEAATLTLRIAYAGTNTSGSCKIRLPNLVGDEGLVTVDCLGKENAAGEWVNTASRAVKELLSNDIGLTNINTASFDEAHEDCPHVLSLASPLEDGGDQEIIRDVIGKINASVFGSLSNNSDWDLTYSVYDQKKPSTLEVVRDDDLIAPITIESKNDIVRKVNARYSRFTDTVTGEHAFQLYEWANDFVDKLVGITTELEVDLYLFNLSSAKIMAQRWAMFRSLSQSTVAVKTDLRMALKNVGDKIYLDLDRLYKRLGNRDRLKIGVINSITRDATTTSITFVDMGNSYNRIGAIASNTAAVYTGASADEKIKSSYIVDDDTSLPDNSNDKEIYINLIG
jgi:hypothetical protein